jgi:AraC-like DNA-binding protein
MEFNVYKPTLLNDLVLSIYERKVDNPTKVQFLPDGVVTLIFNIGTASTSVKGKKIDTSVFNPTEKFCFLSGLHTKPLYFHFDALHVVGLIMSPAAVKTFFSMPTEEVKDQAIEGSFLTEMNYIEDQLRERSSFLERAHWLESYFFTRLNQVADLHLAIKLNKTVQQMKNDVLHGKRFVLEAYSGYSKMHTHRIFKDWLGLTPGKLIRYEQFQHAMNLMHQTELNLTQIAHASGFFDQAHFNRVFFEFANMTPGQYNKNKTAVPGTLPW